MNDETDKKCPAYHFKYYPVRSNDITGDRMPPHGGSRKRASCNHPQFPKSGSRILSPLRCGGDFPTKCEIPALKERFAPE